MFIILIKKAFEFFDQVRVNSRRIEGYPGKTLATRYLLHSIYEIFLSVAL